MYHLHRCEKCFINWSTVIYGTSKLNKVMHYHYHVDLEGVNIPSQSFAKTVNNTMWLAFLSYSFYYVYSMNDHVNLIINTAYVRRNINQASSLVEHQTQ